jgi:hypothetical protein
MVNARFLVRCRASYLGRQQRIGEIQGFKYIRYEAAGTVSSILTSEKNINYEQVQMRASCCEDNSTSELFRGFGREILGAFWLHT